MLLCFRKRTLDDNKRCEEESTLMDPLEVKVDSPEKTFNCENQNSESTTHDSFDDKLEIAKVVI